ncbi:MAG TPA: hypothetical protein VJS92_01720 [Candidatus Polarisedimenticolaceae bacterium]|nr:hypothetical protein [Candidatus Polarisedimenticolaceae bacterium]
MRRIGVALAALALAACGKRGSPQPPEPRGPFPASSVVARQIGARVEVDFTIPRPRTALPSSQPIRAELWRMTNTGGLAVPVDPEGFRRRGERLAQLEGDPLVVGARLRLSDEQPGVGRGLRYAVRIADRRDHLSPWALAPDLTLLEPVAAPRALTAEPTAEGIRLVWQPPGAGSFTYNVYRAGTDERWPERPVNAAPVAGTEYLDAEAETGGTYSYAVRVALADAAPYREGETSASVHVVAEDRFAPPTPQGLVAVQEGAAVRLFWDPTRARDLAGYRVYRSRADGPWVRIGPDPIAQPLFLDGDVRGGERLAYRVSAVDAASPQPNESVPSASVELEIGAEPGTEPPR